MADKKKNWKSDDRSSKRRGQEQGSQEAKPKRRGKKKTRAQKEKTGDKPQTNSSGEPEVKARQVIPPKPLLKTLDQLREEFSVTDIVTVRMAGRLTGLGPNAILERIHARGSAKLKALRDPNGRGGWKIPADLVKNLIVSHVDEGTDEKLAELEAYLRRVEHMRFLENARAYYESNRTTLRRFLAGVA